jgi:hypothetical protein
VTAVAMRAATRRKVGQWFDIIGIIPEMKLTAP